MRLLMHEPRLCTLHELQTIYSLEDMYFMLEMIDVQEALKEEQIKANTPKPQPRNR